jgi:hypothetical protein
MSGQLEQVLLETAIESQCPTGPFRHAVRERATAREQRSGSPEEIGVQILLVPR